MHILYIEHYAGSKEMGMEYRPYYLTKEWQSQGHKVTIVAATFTHLRKKNPTVANDFEEQTLEGVDFVWVKTRSYVGNGLGRVLNILQFTRKVKRKAKMLAKKYSPDVVIASSTYPLDIYCSKKIADSCGAKLCFELHDLWPMSPMVIGGLTEKHPIIRVLQKAEDTAFRESDYIVSLLPGADRHMIERGFSTKNFYYVPNGVIIAEQKIVESHEPTVLQLKELKDDGWFIVAYTGNHSMANELETLINVSPQLTEMKIKIVLVGQGNYKQELVNFARDNAYKNVLLLDSVSKESMPALLSYVDVAYMGLKADKLFEYGVSPNKLYDYMLAGLPIIYAVKACNDPVAEAICGITVQPSNTAEVAEAIIKFYEMPAGERIQMGMSGRDYVKKYHDYPALARQFADILEGKV